MIRVFTGSTGFLSFCLCVGLAGPADAICTGSVAGGVTLTQPTTLFVRNAGSCAVINTAPTVSPSSLATVTVAGNGFLFTPQANGSGSIIVAVPGYTTLTVPLTVTLGTLDLDSQ